MTAASVVPHVSPFTASMYVRSDSSDELNIRTAHECCIKSKLILHVRGGHLSTKRFFAMLRCVNVSQNNVVDIINVNQIGEHILMLLYVLIKQMLHCSACIVFLYNAFLLLMIFQGELDGMNQHHVKVFP